jgi:hypothetical protein
LGIGTTTPVSALHILNHTAVSTFTGTTNEVLTIDGSGYTGIDFNDVGGGGNMLPKARIAMYESSSGSYLALGTTAGWYSGITNQAMTIDYNGNVGIGTTAPNSPLQVNGSGGGGLTGTTHLGIFSTSNTYGVSGIDFGGKNSANPEARIVMSSGGSGSLLSFGTSNNYSSGITNTAMTIDYNGNVGIGTTTPYSRLTLWGPDTSASTAAETIANSASTTLWQVFDNGNATLTGCLNYNGGTSGTCLSDERVKQNIAPFTDSLSDIVGLNPVTYQYNGLAGTPNDNNTRTGLIAQQVQQVAPDLVATTSALLNPGDTSPTELLEVNYSALTFALINAIKDIASISGAFQTNLIAWLGNASNGITKLFAGEVDTNKLCVSDGTNDPSPICVTKSQLVNILAGTYQSSPSVQVSQPTSPVVSTSTPPTISIQGDNPATIHVGDTYTDLGAIVTDNQGTSLGYKTFVNGVLESTIVIDTSTTTIDTITYVATDTWGNTSTSTRTVIIAPTQ